MQDLSDFLKFATLHKASYQKFLMPIAKKYQMKISDLTLLLLLHYSSYVKTAKDIGDFSELKRGNISVIVESLTQKEFIRQEIDPDDRRSKFLFLTEKCDEIVKECDEVAVIYKEILTEGITEEEMNLCEKVFNKMCKNMENFTVRK